MLEQRPASVDPLQPPLLTAGLPGVGGRVKCVPEDFEVEELPAYQPSGRGDFLYLWVEKRDMGAAYFVRQVAQRLGLSVAEVGTAGLKDRHAITRQMVSVPSRAQERLHDLEGDGLRLLQVSRHGHKLRAGHLRGNRFRILVRDVAAGAADRLGPVLARLQQEGLPNYYGPQRFGRNGETAELGLSLLQGRSRAAERRRISPFLRKLALSAAQSALFNNYLARRLCDGLLRTVLPGDVMSRRPFGGLFVAADIEREQARFEGRETIHTGPIFGRKTFPAAGPAAEREAAVLQAAGLSPESFAGFGKLLQGTRRPNLVYIDDLSAGVAAEGIRLCFTLPAGTYATVLLREVMKSVNDDGEEVL